jgi:hypothetical protein
MMAHVALSLILVGMVIGGAPRAVSAAQRVLDRFDDTTAWSAIASDGVRASVQLARGPDAGALRLDFDLAGTAGYAGARRALPLALPPRYELSFWLRAEAPVNTLQLKFVDASGDNVWWVNRPNYEFSKSWQRVTIKSRHVQFAWGPTPDRTLRHAASVELVVAAGRGGGRGSLYLSDFVLRELPDETAGAPEPVVTASSSLRDAPPSLVSDGNPATAWRSDRADGRRQHVVVDFGRPHEFGGLVVRWDERAHASAYAIEFSDDGVRWRTVSRTTDGRGGVDAVMLPDAETRFVRLALSDGPARAYGIAELEVKPLEFGASPNAFFQALAREAPRGTYPRGFSGEQSAWTIVGVDGGRESGLLSQDGALEVARGGFSIEPFVISDSRVVTWADVDTRQSLLDGDLPIPRVTWHAPQWELRVTAFATGSPQRSDLVARYELVNLTAHALPLELVLAARPFQVNPPEQFLNVLGGVSAIRHVTWEAGRLSVNGERSIIPLQPPDHVGALPLVAGPIVARLRTRDWVGRAELHDDAGYASAGLGYRLTLAPHASATLGVVVPLSGPAREPDLGDRAPAVWLEREQAAVAAAWRERLDRVEIRVPAAAEALVRTLRTALAHILVTRDGPVLRPGTRAYARSWIRDGAMIAESLVRLGHPDVAADYLRWYAPQQFANGKVPCCIDERGVDPVAENDSPGQLIFLASEIYRYTRDRALLEATWPNVEAAARYLEVLRHSERTDANRRAERRAFYGLLPASISHEGYAAKPMHSYWDNFWGLKGYEGAVAIARALGRRDDARRLERQRDEFRADVLASLRHAIAAHRIGYLPGAAELGDFDPASSTIALAPAGELHRLPRPLVVETFERYWREFVERRDGRKAWDDYTPYELRTVGTFVRLGWRERAHDLLAFFMAGRRPAGWNQWPEVVGRDDRPRFIGDLPHAWVAADFIRSALDLFAYEREGDGALVLAAGVPSTWLGEKGGVAVKNLRTPYGRLSYSLERRGRRLVLQVGADSQAPPGGFVFAWQGVERRLRSAPGTLVIDDR